MNLEWSIPLKTLVVILFYGSTAPAAYSYILAIDQGLGWAIMTTFVIVVVGAILIELWEWLDELISEEEIELAWEGLDGYESA